MFNMSECSNGRMVDVPDGRYSEWSNGRCLSFSFFLLSKSVADFSVIASADITNINEKQNKTIEDIVVFLKFTLLIYLIPFAFTFCTICLATD